MGLFKQCMCWNENVTQDEKSLKIKKQEDEIRSLKERLEKQKEKTRDAEREWSTKIDEFVENWFEENKDDVDIGIINIGPFRIDIFPDFLEKYIYKKILIIAYSFLNTRT